MTGSFRINRWRGRRRGVILIITLWILVMLSSVALTYAFYSRLDLEMTRYSANSARARYLAKAGFYRACIYLRDDKLKDEDLLENDDLVEVDDDDRGFIYDGLNEEWNSYWFDEEEENDDFLKKIEFGRGTFKVRVIDEAGKINVNVASQRVLQDLLMVTGVEEKKALAISAAIVDWRDEDDEPSDGGEEGFGDLYSEDTYYNPDQKARDIEENGPEYVNKNAYFDDLEELLLVFGMTPYIFYGEDANGNGILDDNEKDGNRTPPDDDGDDRLLLGLQPYLTVFSEQVLNINTAPQKVLEALCLELDDHDADRIAEDIVEYRLGSDDQPGTRDDRPIRTIDDSDGDRYHIDKMSRVFSEASNLDAFHRRIRLGVASDIFTIESIGEVDDVQRKLTTVVQRVFTEPLELKGKDTAQTRQEEREAEKKMENLVQFYVLRSWEEGL